MKKLAFLLTLVLIVSTFSVSVFAAATDKVIIKDTIEYTNDGDALVFTLKYEGSELGKLGGRATFDTTKLEFVESNNSKITYNKTAKRVNFMAEIGEVGEEFTFTLRALKDTNGNYYDVNGLEVKFTGVKVAVDGVQVSADAVDTIATIKKAASSEPTIVENIAADSAEYTVVQGATNSYWGVWVGTYTVNAGGKTLTKAVIDFATAGKTFTADELNVEGSGDVEFQVAIIGVPEEYKDASVATATLQ